MPRAPAPSDTLSTLMLPTVFCCLSACWVQPLNKQLLAGQPLNSCCSAKYCSNPRIVSESLMFARTQNVTEVLLKSVFIWWNAEFWALIFHTVIMILPQRRTSCLDSLTELYFIHSAWHCVRGLAVLVGVLQRVVWFCFALISERHTQPANVIFRQHGSCGSRHQTYLIYWTNWTYSHSEVLSQVTSWWLISVCVAGVFSESALDGKNWLIFHGHHKNYPVIFHRCGHWPLGSG